VSDLGLSIDGPVGRIELSRPARLNALGLALLEELTLAARRLDRVPGLKVVLVSGSGRGFSAGFDLDDFAGALSEPPGSEFCDLGRQAAEALAAMRQITIAAIHGPCVGGGLVLAMACDLRLAADDARFSIPEIELGIPLAWSGIPRLVREVGPAIAKELVLTSRPFDADEARRLGLLNAVVPARELAAEADTLAASLARRPALALQLTKRHADAVAEEAGTTAQSFRETHSFLAALQDPESRAAMVDYLTVRGRVAAGAS
jgi:enoyl-CoA hydratase/carnithine racemase